MFVEALSVDTSKPTDGSIALRVKYTPKYSGLEASARGDIKAVELFELLHAV